MRIANLRGRASLVLPAGLVDVQHASAGRFGPDLPAIYDRWPEFSAWARTVRTQDARQYEVGQLSAPSPSPRQVFAVGLNYAPHVDEGGFVTPESPMIFTKFPSCITDPFSVVPLPSGNVDWEVELVLVIGRRAEYVASENAWDCVAGVTLGQDFSERVVQTAGSVPQFSMGKSFPNFGPTGPMLVTVDEFPNPDDIALSCRINGEVVQEARSRDLIFSVPKLICWLSSICPLLPGDLVFTGTPGGTGSGQTPPRYLQVEDVVTSTAELIGTMHNRCTAGRSLGR